MTGIIRVLIGVTVTIILAITAFPIVLVNAAERLAGIEPAAAQQLLQATVQIRMYAPAPGQPGKDIVADGLGTVVQAGGASYIVTHNHWGFVYEDLTRADIWNAHRRQVTTLNAAAFRQLVRYSDAGTLVISAPPGLAVFPTSMNESLSLGTGDIVQIVHHPTGRQTEVELIEAVVILTSAKDGLSTVILFSLNGQTIVNGDSGGGIWHSGQLVGNMWMTINSAVSQDATAISIMATLPTGAQTELTAHSQPAATDGDGSYLSQLLLEGSEPGSG